MVKIGVFIDMFGFYLVMGGQGLVVVVKMVVEDCFKNECKGMKIEIFLVDNQNKFDVGVMCVCEWLDCDKVEVIVDFINFLVVLVVQKLIKDKGGIVMYSGLVIGVLIIVECVFNGFYWMFDIYL